MNKTEYSKISDEDFEAQFGHSKWKYYNEAKKRLFHEIKLLQLLRPKAKIVLCHLDENDNNFELWQNIEPRFKSFHSTKLVKEFKERLKNDMLVI